MRKTIAAIVTLGTVSSMLAGTVYAATNTTNATSTGNTANATASATSNTTSNTTGSAPTNPNVLTQKSAVYQLIEVFNTIPSWPTGLQSIDPATQNAQWDWKYKPIPPSQWVGLACVFPGDPESKYAADLGIQMTDPNGPVTAGQLAQWIVDWEIKARHVNMAWEPSQDPYTLLQDFSFFYGTDVKGPNSVLTQKDMMAIRNNIVEVSRGWRQLGTNKVELLEPLMDPNAVSGAFVYLAKHHEDWSLSDWPKVYLAFIRTVDSQTLTFEPNGNVIYTYKRGTGLTPNVTGVFEKGVDTVYSSYSYSDQIGVEAYKEDNPSLNSKIFYEPDYQVFSPKTHLSNYHYSYPGYVPPSNGQIAFELWGTVCDPYTARVGGAIFIEGMYEFTYYNGHLVNAHQIGQESENYPSEVTRYGD
ncbi:hypothetical protein SAMN05421799_1142 [Alicyclobacillus vulcanalis]|uniref:SLH domain-containing protein n=1 Tax=Alicyclobacillus vulcanalis TaxID=252246 RepID=A0A1N7PJ52_9BACL|nr:hypothetical protein SAMN05421799_1142 [Alicyclobacillus vulcanalis]